MKPSEAVALYVKLREQKSQLKKQHDKEAAAITEKMDKIELKLMELFSKAGIDSLKTEFGTAYTTTRVSATVADREAFMRFLKEKDEWPLADIRAAKSAIEQYVAANDGELPPGINYRQERVVNIRQSA